MSISVLMREFQTLLIIKIYRRCRRFVVFQLAHFLLFFFSGKYLITVGGLAENEINIGDFKWSYTS